MSNGVSHDQNFKNLILDYPREALEFFAAEEAPSRGDDVRIIPVREQQLKERLHDRFRELDTPLLAEWADGRREAILFALEEESESRSFSPHRLAHYCLDLAQMFRTNRVVPVVIFLREAADAPASLTLGTERRAYLSLDYLTCKLGDIPAERWMRSDNLVARVNLPNMRSPAGRKAEVYGHAVRGLLALEQDGGMRAKYIDFIDTYASLTDNEFRRYQQQYPEESSTMAGIVQRARDAGIEQGIEQGMQQGMRQGRVEGERAVLERQLRRRFGLLLPEVGERLERASATELENWAEKVLDAETLDDVFD